MQLAFCQSNDSNLRQLDKKDSLKNFGGPARIRTGDRQVSRTRGYEHAALSVLQPEENLAELRALQAVRTTRILNVLEGL